MGLKPTESVNYRKHTVEDKTNINTSVRTETLEYDQFADAVKIKDTLSTSQLQPRKVPDFKSRSKNTSHNEIYKTVQFKNQTIATSNLKKTIRTTSQAVTKKFNSATGEYEQSMNDQEFLEFLETREKIMQNPQHLEKLLAMDNNCNLALTMFEEKICKETVGVDTNMNQQTESGNLQQQSMDSTGLKKNSTGYVTTYEKIYNKYGETSTIRKGILKTSHNNSRTKDLRVSFEENEEHFLPNLEYEEIQSGISEGNRQSTPSILEAEEHPENTPSEQARVAEDLREDPVPADEEIIDEHSNTDILEILEAAQFLESKRLKLEPLSQHQPKKIIRLQGVNRSANIVEFLDEHDELAKSLKLKNRILIQQELDIVKFRRKINTLQSIQNSRLMKEKEYLHEHEKLLEKEREKFHILCKKNRKLGRIIETLLKNEECYHSLITQLIDNLTMGGNFMGRLIKQLEDLDNKRDEWAEVVKRLQNKEHDDVLKNLNNYDKKNDEYAREKMKYYLTKSNIKVMEALEEQKHKKLLKECQKLEKQFKTFLKVLSKIYEYLDEPKFNVLLDLFAKAEHVNIQTFKQLLDINMDFEYLRGTLSIISLDVDEWKAHTQLEAIERKETLEKLAHESQIYKMATERVERKRFSYCKKLYRLSTVIGKFAEKHVCRPIFYDNTLIRIYVIIYLELYKGYVKDYIYKVYSIENTLIITEPSQIIYPLDGSWGITQCWCFSDKVINSNSCEFCTHREILQDALEDLPEVFSAADAEELRVKPSFPAHLKEILDADDWESSNFVR